MHRCRGKDGALSAVNSSSQAGDECKLPYVVFFIGGATASEIAAIRVLGKRDGRQYIIVTTGRVSSHVLLSSLSAKFDCSDWNESMCHGQCG